MLTEAGQLVVFHAMDSTADWVDDGDGLGWEDVALRPPGGGRGKSTEVMRLVSGS